MRHEHSREMARRAIEIDPLDGNSMHAVGITALYAGDFPAAAEAFGEWNQFYPGNRWSYVKHAVALALVGQCDASLRQAEAGEQLSERPPSPLMESWLAWTHYACDRKELYERSKTRIYATVAEDPERLDAALIYLYAVEGDDDSMLDLLQRVVEAKSPLTFATQIPLVDYMGWPVTTKLTTNDAYLELLRGLNFPASKWSVN